MVGRDEATLRAALAQLEESELVFRSGEPPAARYTFKHALVQDTAYESLLKSRRQILHQRIAEALARQIRRRRRGRAGTDRRITYTRAGLTEPAIVHWGKAGDLALRRSAFKEAIAHLGKAIEMTEAGAGEESVKPRERLKLQVSYGNALIAARGYGARKPPPRFRARANLAVGIEDASERFSADLRAVGRQLCARRTRTDARARRDFLARLRRSRRSPEACVAHRINGVTSWFAGDFVAARAFIWNRHSLSSTPSATAIVAFRFGQDVGVAAMASLALTLWPLGEVDRARLRSRGHGRANS